MQVTKITDTYSVSSQINEADIAEIKAAGFKTVMCNRPDGEEIGQPEVAAIAAAAKEHGLKFFHVPMDQTGITQSILDNFQEAVVEENAPVFAYCRTGNRCTMLWNATKA